MTPTEAKELLLLHGFSHPDSATDPRAAAGFLGSLRPYRGRLEPRNFHEVLAALRVLSPTLEEPLLDREVVSALWGIVHLARAWGVHEDGMLRRNRLISDADVATLTEWIETISYATCCLLDGTGVNEAFADVPAFSAADDASMD